MAEKSGMQFQVDAHFLAFVATRSVSVVRRKVALASQLRFGFMDRPPGIVFRVVLVGRSEGSDLSNHFFGRSAFCQRALRIRPVMLRLAQGPLRPRASRRGGRTQKPVARAGSFGSQPEVIRCVPAVGEHFGSDCKLRLIFSVHKPREA